MCTSLICKPLSCWDEKMLKRPTLGILTCPPSSPSGRTAQHGRRPSRRLLRCQQCSYVTPSSDNLKRHWRIHTGERPHQCGHCGKAFVESGHLVTHLRIHTGERPYQCHLCPRVFTQKAALTYHLHTHTGERPFCCRFCAETFRQRGHQKRHEKKAHGQHQ